MKYKEKANWAIQYPREADFKHERDNKVGASTVYGIQSSHFEQYTHSEYLKLKKTKSVYVLKYFETISA